MGRLSDCVFGIFDVFCMHCSVESKALVDWNLTAERLIPTDQYNERAKDNL